MQTTIVFSSLGRHLCPTMTLVLMVESSGTNALRTERFLIQVVLTGIALIVESNTVALASDRKALSFGCSWLRCHLDSLHWWQPTTIAVAGLQEGMHLLLSLFPKLFANRYYRTIRLPNDTRSPNGDSGVIATLASVPWFIVGIAGIGYEWVASRVDTYFFRSRGGYRNVPIDEDAQILRFEDEE